MAWGCDNGSLEARSRQACALMRRTLWAVVVRPCNGVRDESCGVVALCRTDLDRETIGLPAACRAYPCRAYPVNSSNFGNGHFLVKR